ncbi:DegT/DnrJ/EryC1/StrS aminotransferase family protein [Gammaproteobacteria bacterium]
MKGGKDKPMSNSTQPIFPTWPSYTDAEIEATVNVLRSGRVNYWTGKIARSFEREFAEYTGVANAIAVCNGSVALGAALRAMGIGQRDEVIVTPRTFVASASEIVLAGAVPVFADVDSDSQNITPATIEPLITSRTRAILAVHLAGWPCPMPEIMKLATQYGLGVIEDCAQSHGAAIDGRKVGSWGNVNAFSFCQDKIITTGGEGGMITTDNSGLWQTLWSMKDHGKNYEISNAPSNGVRFKWMTHSFGTNWRLTEMQAAIGRLQLKMLDDWLQLRRRNAHALLAQLEGEPALRIPRPAAGIEHAYYKCYVFVRPEMLKSDWNRDRILDELVAHGIPCGSGACPEVYREAAFAKHPSRPQNPLPIVQMLGETSMMFPVHPTLTLKHMEMIGDMVKSILAQATKV